MKNTIFVKVQTFFGNNKVWQSLSTKDKFGILFVITLFALSGLANSLIQTKKESFAEKQNIDLSRFRIITPAQPREGDLVIDLTGTAPAITQK